MKRYIRSSDDFYGHGDEVLDNSIPDEELESEYGDENVTYEFSTLDEMWAWLNDENIETDKTV